MNKSFATCNKNLCSLFFLSLLQLTQCPEAEAAYVGQVRKIKDNRG